MAPIAGRGWLAAIAVLEASHAVAVVCMGKPLEQIEFGLIFERDYDGKTLALPRGRCKLKGVTRDAIDVCPSSVPLSRGTHWKALAKQRRERDRKFAEELERNARRYDVKVTLGSPG